MISLMLFTLTACGSEDPAEEISRALHIDVSAGEEISSSDTHGGFQRFGSKYFPQQTQMGRNDYMIICGDFGGLWDGGQKDQHWLDWLAEKPFTTLFVDGNHENFDLLNALLITSANDAASVIAWDVGGSLNAFIQQMNARAAELGCTSATFTCAHGLYDYGNVASAEDMAKIAAACAANETFAQVAGSTTYTLGQTNFHSEQRTISSSNPLMDASGAYYKDSVKWVKGGFTTLAGRCAVALAQKDGHTYGLVILGSDSNEHLYSECDALFDWAFASFADRPLVDTQTVVTTVDLTKCRTHPEVELYAAAPVSGYGHADDKVSYSFDLPESVSATVKNGQKLGTATVYLDGYEVGQVDLVTHQEYVSDFRTDSRSTLLLLAALAVILLVLSVVTLACGGGSLNLNRRRRMKRRR